MERCAWKFHLKISVNWWYRTCSDTPIDHIIGNESHSIPSKHIYIYTYIYTHTIYIHYIYVYIHYIYIYILRERGINYNHKIPSIFIFGWLTPHLHGPPKPSLRGTHKGSTFSATSGAWRCQIKNNSFKQMELLFQTLKTCSVYIYILYLYYIYIMYKL